MLWYFTDVKKTDGGAEVQKYFNEIINTYKWTSILVHTQFEINSICKRWHNKHMQNKLQTKMFCLDLWLNWGRFVKIGRFFWGLQKEIVQCIVHGKNIGKVWYHFYKNMISLKQFLRVTVKVMSRSNLLWVPFQLVVMVITMVTTWRGRLGTTWGFLYSYWLRAYWLSSLTYRCYCYC